MSVDAAVAGPGIGAAGACLVLDVRVIATLRREVLDRVLIVSERHLCQVLNEYLAHYGNARPHRALGQLPPAHAHSRPPKINPAEHRVRRREVLSGLTSEYEVAA